MKRELQLATTGAHDTRRLAATVAGVLRVGDVVSLTGELGAGKTTFVQGVARGLGVTGTVGSPTFTLVREYHGRLTVQHADVYRLDRVQDVLDLGFEEMTDDAVLIVEWGDAVEGLLPAEHLSVELAVPGEDERRRLILTGAGRSWATRWERLEQALERWGGAA